MLDPEQIKFDFPILSRKINDKPLIYLDSAATSQKPLLVLDAMSDYYEKFNANTHRGIYTLAEASDEIYDNCRRTVAEFFNARKTEEIIFTSNATSSINLAAYSWGRTNLKKGDRIAISLVEHHSNFLPWKRLEEEIGIELKLIIPDEKGRIDQDNISKALDDDLVKLLVIQHASNVLGTVNDIKSISKLVHDSNSLIFVDGTQATVRMKVDFQDLNVDFYVSSAHKMYGPMGVGFLYIKEEIMETMEPYMLGGGMINEVGIEETKLAPIPQRFEAGTQNVAGVVGFATALHYMDNIGLENIRSHETELTKYAIEKLNEIDELTIYGPDELDNRCGVISFNLDNIHAHDLATIADRNGVCIRVGHHCCQLLMNHLNVPATARLSLAVHTTKDDIDILIKSINEAKQIFA